MMNSRVNTLKRNHQSRKGKMVEGQEEWEKTQSVASRETMAPRCQKTGSPLFIRMKIPRMLI